MSNTISMSENSVEQTSTENRNNQGAEQRPGMGAIPHEQGVAFRVWAPHADFVSVIGDFNDWKTDTHPMQRNDQGCWYADIPKAQIGSQYKFHLKNGEREFDRIDPYAREVTSSIGNAIVTDPQAFDWGDDDFQMPAWNELVIYELHIGTFHRENPELPGTFDGATKKLEYLRWLGINAIEIMPVGEFAGDISWGYNPAHIFAVESAYGGPQALMRFVKAAHDHGIAVIMDVVYNHFGPSDLDLWEFDGWSEDGKGGIYFYNDGRSSTPWGDSRPDYGRGEVRQFIFDNAMMWIEDFRMDGLRYDMTLYMRSISGSGECEIPEGWSLAQWINREIEQKYPAKITIAEDLRKNAALTAPQDWGGANFSSQWDEAFVHPVRSVIQAANDVDRDMNLIRSAVEFRYNHDSFERVVYTESHDEVANGKKRVPSEIDESDPQGWFARRRSGLGAALVFCSPGIPMIFQGQESVRTDWFDDSDPIDWGEVGEQEQMMRLYRDLIRLRLNREGLTSGLTGQFVESIHLNNTDKVIAFRRSVSYDGSDTKGDVVVAMNFANREWADYRIGFPSPGRWQVRFDSSSLYYAEEGEQPSKGISQIETVYAPYDRYAHSASFRLPAYAAMIFSQD